MKSFISFLKETPMQGSGINADRHVSKYVIPYKDKTYFTLVKKHGNFDVGSQIKIHDVMKDSGKYHAIASPKEDERERINIPLSKISKPVPKRDVYKAENMHLTHLSNEIERVKKETGSTTIDLHIKGKKISGVAGVTKTPGVHKSDFYLHDKQGSPIFHISHKDGTLPTHFQQFGGISHEVNNPPTSQFVTKLKRNYSGGVHGKTVAMKLDHTDSTHLGLIHRSMYGKDYSTKKEHGINNVHALIQGHMHIASENGKHYLKAANIHHHGELPKDTKFILYARGSSDRNDGGIPKTRIAVGVEGSRKISEYI